MKIERIMSVYKHYTGFWVVLAHVRVNGNKRTQVKRLTFDSEEEARAIKEGTQII